MKAPEVFIVCVQNIYSVNGLLFVCRDAMKIVRKSGGKFEKHYAVITIFLLLFSSFLARFSFFFVFVFVLVVVFVIQNKKLGINFLLDGLK